MEDFSKFFLDLLTYLQEVSGTLLDLVTSFFHSLADMIRSWFEWVGL